MNIDLPYGTILRVDRDFDKIGKEEGYPPLKTGMYLLKNGKYHWICLQDNAIKVMDYWVDYAKYEFTPFELVGEKEKQEKIIGKFKLDWN